MRCLILLFAALAWAASNAQRVGLLGCGETLRDQTYRDVLQAHGLQVVWITPYYQLIDATSLQQCEVVVLTPVQGAFNMPVHTQSILEQWVLSGGGMVTVEWTLWYLRQANYFVGLSSLLPATAQPFTQQREVRYTQQTPDPILNAGLDTMLQLGFLKETYLRAVSDATVFYASDYAPNSVGVAGWQVGSGRTISFSVAIGTDSLSEITRMPGSLLLANAVRWAANSACSLSQGDVNRDGCTDDADLLSVLFQFGATAPTDADVNCDGVVDDADLLEVLFRFGTGC
ncbi:MAG: hypothetical protein ACK4ME_07340 [Fimbriimonadales bacterium]